MMPRFDEGDRVALKCACHHGERGTIIRIYDHAVLVRLDKNLPDIYLVNHHVERLK